MCHQTLIIKARLISTYNLELRIHGPLKCPLHINIVQYCTGNICVNSIPANRPWVWSSRKSYFVGYLMENC